MSFHLTDSQISVLRDQFAANSIDAAAKGDLGASAAWADAMKALHDAQMSAQRDRTAKARARRQLGLRYAR